MKMIEEKLIALVDRRKPLDYKDEAVIDCWLEEVVIMLDDMVATKNFIANCASDDVVYWLGEVFDVVASESQDREFVDIIKERAARIADERKKKFVIEDVHDAELAIEND